MYYIGATVGGVFIKEVFFSKRTPTEKTHGKIYRYTIGGFRTKKAAEFMINHPMVATVSQAERLSKQQ